MIHDLSIELVPDQIVLAYLEDKSCLKCHSPVMLMEKDKSPVCIRCQLMEQNRTYCVIAGWKIRMLKNSMAASRIRVTNHLPEDPPA